MRPSNRTAILDAAVRVVEEGGVTAVTLDAVAAEAGLTKGGLIYHFPSRDALLGGIHEHLAAQWEEQLEEQLGGPAAEATPEERLAAYALVSTNPATRAELLLQIEAAFTEHSAPWNAVLDRWTVPADEGLRTTPVEHVIARLAADGLWMYETLGGGRLDEETRQAIADHLAAMIRDKPA